MTLKEALVKAAQDAGVPQRILDQIVANTIGRNPDFGQRELTPQQVSELMPKLITAIKCTIADAVLAKMNEPQSPTPNT